MPVHVFISWSGARSRYVADALRSWLPKVIQSLRPWMSDEDIGAGSRWLSEIAVELNQASAGIICVTPENQANPWLVFEAGALSKTLSQTMVCPLLFDLSQAQLTGPLSQFQANLANREGVARILGTLNKALGDHQLHEPDLLETLDAWWPRLEARLGGAPRVDVPPEKRGTNDLLEEVLSNSREQLRRENIRLGSLKEREEVLEKLFETIAQYLGNLGDNLQNSLVVHPGAGIITRTRLQTLAPQELKQLQAAFGKLIEAQAAERVVTAKLLGENIDNVGGAAAVTEAEGTDPLTSDTARA